MRRPPRQRHAPYARQMAACGAHDRPARADSTRPRALRRRRGRRATRRVQAPLRPFGAARACCCPSRPAWGPAAGWRRNLVRECTCVCALGEGMESEEATARRLMKIWIGGGQRCVVWW
eukprot:271599-Chlamydomonas_euryale.AAC.1